MVARLGNDAAASRRLLRRDFVQRGWRLASVSSTDNTIRIWDAADGKSFCVKMAWRNNPANPAAVDCSVLLSPRMVPLLATAFPVRLWDTKTGKLRRQIGTNKIVTCRSWLFADGKTIAFARPVGRRGQVDQVCIADAATGEELRAPDARGRGLHLCCLRPMAVLAACLGNEVIHRWSALTGNESRLRGHTKKSAPSFFTGDGKT